MVLLIQDASIYSNQKDLKPQRDGDWPQEEKRHEELQDLEPTNSVSQRFVCRKSGQDHVQESRAISGPNL